MNRKRLAQDLWDNRHDPKKRVKLYREYKALQSRNNVKMSPNAFKFLVKQLMQIQSAIQKATSRKDHIRLVDRFIRVHSSLTNTDIFRSMSVEDQLAFPDLLGATKPSTCVRDESCRSCCSKLPFNLKSKVIKHMSTRSQYKLDRESRSELRNKRDACQFVVKHSIRCPDCAALDKLKLLEEILG